MTPREEYRRADDAMDVLASISKPVLLINHGLLISDPLEPKFII